MEVPKSRARFTVEQQLAKEAEVQEQADAKTELEIELERLKKVKVMSGRVTIYMMEAFRKFPWTQHTMKMAGLLVAVLVEFLVSYLEIKKLTIKK